jgi:DNA-binding HxlR family transcriptional regulator
VADEIRNGSSKVRTHASGASRSSRTTLMSADAPPDVLDVRFPTRRILAIIGDRWTTVILYCLSIREHRRFNELQKQIFPRKC